MLFQTKWKTTKTPPVTKVHLFSDTVTRTTWNSGAAVEVGTRQKRDLCCNAGRRGILQPDNLKNLVPRLCCSWCFNPFKQLSVLPSTLPGINAVSPFIINLMPMTSAYFCVFVEFCFWIKSLSAPWQQPGTSKYLKSSNLQQNAFSTIKPKSFNKRQKHRAWQTAAMGALIKGLFSVWWEFFNHTQ